MRCLSVERVLAHLAHRAIWEDFDATWYASRHCGTDGADALGHYLNEGRLAGASPNPWFDEAWFRLHHPDVAEAIRRGDLVSGFEDYCRNPHDERSPHWLFDPAFYRRSGGDFSIFRNCYDHFLQVGDKAGRQPSPYFHPATVLQQLSPEDAKAARTMGVFRYFVERSWHDTGELPLSPNFQPDWYIRSYPAAAAAILRRRVPSALAHYLLNQSSGNFDPLPHFSETRYLSEHADVAEAVATGALRSGYDHYLTYGMAEGRRTGHLPSQPGDLADASDRPHARRANGRTELFPLSEEKAKELFHRRAATAARAATHDVMDFTCDGMPDVSVVMVLHNKLTLTLAALAELESQMPGRLQLILIDSGSTDGTRDIGIYVRGARLIRSETNINFVLACNVGLAEVTGRAVLFLNNDVRLGPGAVRRAFQRLNAEPDIGAVGGMVVRSHGLLQEAGCIIWHDGFTDGYLRDASPDLPEANFVRDVDFCSGVFLTVRAELLQRLGGFDPAFAPAYFEETDLCVRIWQAGFRVVYDPAVRIEHLEYGSSASADAAGEVLRRSHVVFSSKHAKWLQDQPDRTRGQIHARSPRRTGTRPNILVVEDQLPLRAMGSGFVRSNDILRSLAALGFDVTVYPVRPLDLGALRTREDFPDTVEVIDDRSVEDLALFLSERTGMYDWLWIGRTHNLDRLLPILEAIAPADRPGIVLDTEAIASLRQRQMAQRAGLAIVDLESALQHEFRNIAFADRVVAVSESEAELLRQLGVEQPEVLAHMQTPQEDGPGFDARRDLLFVGAMHEPGAPNHEALSWLVDHVLGAVVASLGPHIRLSVIGHTGPEVDLSRFANHPNIALLGRVHDLRPYYRSHRVFVAPTLVAAGIPYKLHEAASEGIPIVATELLAGQLTWTSGHDLLVPTQADPQAFARAIVDLYTSPSLWARLRQNALERIRRENCPAAYRNRLAAILRPLG